MGNAPVKKTVHEAVLAFAAQENVDNKANVVLLSETLIDPDGMFDPALPCLIGNVPTSMELRGQCVAYMESFPGTEEKAKNRRGQKALTPIAAGGLENVLQSLFHDSQRLTLTPEEMMKVDSLRCAMMPSIFVVDKRLETSAFELGQLPTVRLCIGGSKTFVVVSGAAVYQYLDSTGKKYDGKQVAGFLRDMTAKDLEAFVAQGHTIWYGKQEAGHGIYMPPGHLFWEQIGDSDFGGAKSVVLLGQKKDGTGKDAEMLLSDVCKVLMQHSSNNLLMTSARDIMAARKGA